LASAFHHHWATTGTTPHVQLASSLHCGRYLHSAPRMGSWFGKASTCPPSHDIRWSGDASGSGGSGVGSEVAPPEITVVASRVAGSWPQLWHLLLSWWDSCKRLSATCESESESSRVRLALCLQYFCLVAATLTSSSLVLLQLSGSRSGLTGSGGPPKRTLWRK
jgi:hypothetical protein